MVLSTVIVLLPFVVVIALAVPLVLLQRRQFAALPHRDALAGLAAPERTEVRDAVRTGRPVADPTLAAATTAWAEHEIAAGEVNLRWQRVLRWVYVGLAVIVVAAALTDRDGHTWLFTALFTVLLIGTSFFNIARYQRAIARARAAITANG
ncbi:hypothetical protein [Cryptosporangium phraense]|uniref:Uncharacterized protein n=1 Tax=Cryptosporangium phraense TaxID=2593070 RepID=A0A545AUG9_9ACTN|nr:hypothetical protein [Cryptosporangium phraense]TQS44979.1 hypothetical protein FL583_10760 [Cryptosporangium phraense]